MASPQGIHPQTSNYFTVSIDAAGVAYELGYFMSVNGLSATIETEPVPEGGNNAFVHQLPKGMTFGNVTLKRGLIDAHALWKWIDVTGGWGMAKSKNVLQRGSCAIQLKSKSGSPVRTWVLTGAFPVRWSGVDFSAADSNIATEELEIAHNGFYIDEHAKTNKDWESLS